MTQQTIDKLEQAKVLIASGLPIWRAAMRVGWGSPQLQIMFKKKFGITPGEWARQLPPRARNNVYGRTLESSEIQSVLKTRRGRVSRHGGSCDACGADFDEAPVRCPKCGSYAIAPRQINGPQAA